VARPRDARRSHRPGGRLGAVAADLEGRGDVGGAIQRPGSDGAQHSDPRRLVGAQPPCLAESPRVALEHGDEADRERRRQRRAKGHAAKHAQDLVGIDRGGQDR
jgi:hypothetical protein